MTDQEHKEESLLDIIGGCSDDSKHEEKEKILAKFRFASELQQKTLVPADLSLADLEEAIYTAAYLGLDSDDLAEQFLQKLGRDEKEIERFFVKKPESEDSTNLTLRKQQNSHMVVIFSELSRHIKEKGVTFIDFGSSFIPMCPDKCKTKSEDAVLGGHLECLMYAHENGCERDVRHLECLKYAHENGYELEVQNIVATGV